MIKQKRHVILLVAVLLSLVVTSHAQTVPPASQQDTLIAVLNASDASRQQKATACRELSFIATKKAIPALVRLLADEEMNHMARYTLETLPDKAVDDALLGALGRLQGKPLVGVIGSLGVRGETRAVTPLAERLTHQDPMIARAAARALGSLGNIGAARALTKALPGSTGDTKLAVCEGLFRCAEQMGGVPAVAIYDRLGQLEAPHQVRAGALRGAILTREDGLDLLKTSLKSEDYILFSAAAQTALEMPGIRVTQALAAALSEGPADHRILILGILAKRGDPAALSAIATAAGRGDRAVRIAAIEAMPPIGNATALNTLVTLITDADAEIAKAAQASFAALPGPAADKAVRDMLANGDKDSQLLALKLIEQRRMTNVAPALVKAAKDDDAAVRAASIKMLGDLEGLQWFPTLIGMLLDAQGSQEVRAAERALSNICTRDAQALPGQVTIRKAVYGAVGAGGSKDVTEKVAKLVKSGAATVTASNAQLGGDPASGLVKQLRVEFTANGVTQVRTVKEGQSITLLTSVTPEAYVNGLCAALPKASSRQKQSLLRVLRVAQGSKALGAVRTASKDADAGVRAEAISLLCGWPSVDVLPEVLALTKTATDRTTKILALRGAIRLIPLQPISAQDKLAGLKALVPLIERGEEKRLLLGSLAAMPIPAALAMTTPYLDDATVRNEACFAVITIAEKRAPKNKAELTAALQKVLKITSNNEVKKRARQVLKKIRE